MRLESGSILFAASCTGSVRRKSTIHIVAVEAVLRFALADIVRDGVEVRAQVRAGAVCAGALIAVGDVVKGIVLPILAVVGAGVGVDCPSWTEGFAGINGTWADIVPESAAITTGHGSPWRCETSLLG